MRKILAIVLALVMVMGMSTTAFATTEVKTTELTTYVYSTWEITIPASVNLVETDGEINISVDALNLDPELVLAVMLDRYNMMHSNGNKANLELYVDGVQKTNVIATFTEPGSVIITAKMEDGALAGNYTGVVVFYIGTLSMDDPGLTS